MAVTPTRSFRLRPETVALLEAWAALRGTTPPKLIEWMLRSMKVPDAAGELEARVRAAHKALVDVL